MNMSGTIIYNYRYTTLAQVGCFIANITYLLLFRFDLSLYPSFKRQSNGHGGLASCSGCSLGD